MFQKKVHGLAMAYKAFVGRFWPWGLPLCGAFWPYGIFWS